MEDQLAPGAYIPVVRHQTVIAPLSQVPRHVAARGHLHQKMPQLLSQAPAIRLLGGLRDLFQRQLEQPVLGAVRKKKVITQREVMRPARRLAHLTRHIELAAQEALLPLDTLVVGADPALE